MPGVQDANHDNGVFEATHTATSTRYDGDALFFRDWQTYHDGAAVWNGQVYLAVNNTLMTGDFSGSLEGLTSVDTGLLSVSSAAAYPDGTSGLLLTGRETSGEGEGLYRFSQDGLEKLADLSSPEYFNDPSAVVWCSYARENQDGTISVPISSSLLPQFLETVVTLPAPEPEPTPDPDPERNRTPNPANIPTGPGLWLRLPPGKPTVCSKASARIAVKPSPRPCPTGIWIWMVRSTSPT